MKILVTGGAGYIGSTICAALEDAGHTPIILDSLINGRIEFTRERLFYHGDIADPLIIKKIFTEHPTIDCVIHCAALIVVPDSVARPAEYYHENVVKTLRFFETLLQYNCRQVVYSSSASVYDDVPEFMVTENSPLNPRSPYARTKYMVELIMKDFATAYGLKGIALRYFNPIGADPKLRSGVYLSQPSHVLGKLVSVAQGIEPVFQITGTEWSTRDGSGIRDYLHVWDLAQAHVKAVEHFQAALDLANLTSPYLAINLGTGRGVTVKELVAAFEKVFQKPLPKEFAPPRPGDVAGSYANADTAKKLLDWQAELSIEAGISDALRWAAVRNEILNLR